jgi:hypothetical protein
MCPIVFASSLRLKDPLELVQSRDFIVIHIPSMMILKEFSLVRDVVFIILSLSLSLFLSLLTHTRIITVSSNENNNI